MVSNVKDEDVNFEGNMSLPVLISHTNTGGNSKAVASNMMNTEEFEKILSESESKLVIHFDINETILIGDEAGGDSVEDCLNKVR